MNNRRLYYKVLAPFASLIAASAVQAQDIDTSIIDEALNNIGQQNEAAVESQERINRLANSTSTMYDEFSRENDTLEALLIRNANFRRLISIQEENIATVDESITEVAAVTREMPFLMEQMISSVEQFVELDMPFQLEQRRQAIEFARNALNNPDVSIAEQFRQVLVLYQNEVNYGRTHQTYPATVEVDGQERDVNMLRVGRIALVYQTADREITGAWDQENRQWITLSPSEYRTAVQRAIDVSSGVISQEIINLPIEAPESAQ